MRVLECVGVRRYDPESKYVRSNNNYYVYDASTGCVEYCDGSYLIGLVERGVVRLNGMTLELGKFVYKANELILCNNGIHIYVWYQGVCTVWNNNDTYGIDSLLPVVVGFGFARKLDEYVISYNEMIKRLVLC